MERKQYNDGNPHEQCSPQNAIHDVEHTTKKSQDNFAWAAYLEVKSL